MWKKQSKATCDAVWSPVLTSLTLYRGVAT